MPDSAGESQKRHRSKFRPHSLVASSSTYLISYGLRRATEDRLLNQHRAAALQEILVRIVSSPFCNRLPYPDLEVLNGDVPADVEKEGAALLALSR